MEEKELDEEKKLKDVGEMVKVTRILQELLDTKISKIIQNELSKNRCRFLKIKSGRR